MLEFSLKFHSKPIYRADFKHHLASYVFFELLLFYIILLYKKFVPIIKIHIIEMRNPISQIYMRSKALFGYLVPCICNNSRKTKNRFGKILNVKHLFMLIRMCYFRFRRRKKRHDGFKSRSRFSILDNRIKVSFKHFLKIIQLSTRPVKETSSWTVIPSSFFRVRYQIIFNYVT